MEKSANLDPEARRRDHAAYMREYRRRKFIKAMCGEDSPTKGNLAESRKAAKQPSRTREERMTEQRALYQRVAEALEKEGVDLNFLARTIREGLGSTLTWRTYDRETKQVIHEHDIDYRTRQKYVETAAELLRAKPSSHESTQTTNILVLNLPTDPEMSIEEWNRTVAAKATAEHGRLVSEETQDPPQAVASDPSDE